MCVDLTDPVAVRTMVALAVRTYGRLDALVNNAALDPKFEPGQEARHRAAFEDYPLEAWDQGLAAAFRDRLHA